MAVVKDKKDVSVLIETQFPEFVTEKHPKFKKFIEKYYEFMESHQLYFGTTFTFNEDKIVDESDGTSYFLYEDGINSIQLESERDTENDANIQFTIGETLTGNTSQATAVVTGTKGNTVAFIKPSNDASFKYGEKVTGSATRGYATLANGVVDGTFPDGSIESFRSRGAGVAVRDLKRSQDIDLASEGLIDVAWKKEFYVNIPKTATTDRRQLLKQMKEVYRAKGNESSFHWLFRTLYAKTVGHIPGVLQEIEFYYPGTDLLKVSDGKWVLDKTIKFTTVSGTNISLFTGRKITGGTSGCTALVEKQVTYAAGSLEITELTLSNIIQGVVEDVLTDFTEAEIITSTTDSDGLYATATLTGVVQTVTIDVGGTNYIVGDEIHITKGGGFGARARVSSIKNGVVNGITIIDSGDGYSVGDTLNFINEETGGTGAAGTVKTIIKTTEVLKNTDLIQTNQVTTYRLTKLNAADYGSTFVNHNANTHLFGNSSLIFSASIKLNSGKLYNVQGDYNAASHILAGDRIAKQASINTSDKTITQSVRTVTLSSGLSETEKIDVVGGKLVYANNRINIITGFSSNNVLLVKDDLSFGVGENFNINYASNTYWGTIISASATEILYSVGSHYRGSDLGTLTVQNFVNDDTIIIYDSKFTKLGAAAAASGIDAHNMHNGVTFQVGNTPISNTTSSLHNGAFNMTTVNVGAIDTFTLSSGGVGYTSSPPVSVANSYIPTLGNALDVVGAPNALLNLNLHSYDTGTISQNGTIITLDTDGSFPDANSGVLTLTYANGTTAQITAVTNSSTLNVSTEKIFGLGVGPSPDRESYSLSYMAHANNITRNTLLYNDDYSARGRVLDFIDKSTDYLKLSRIGNPVIANGNTTLRVDMTTAQDFGGVVEQILLESKTTSYDHEKLLIEGDIAGHFLIEDSVTFLTLTNTGNTVASPAVTTQDLDDAILQEDGSRFYTEDTTGERVTAHSNSVSTYTTGTITQSGLTVTGIGTVFPNDFVRGTITYADDATSTITGYTNATSFTVEDSKTISSAQTYSISYNPVLTWGTSRNITVSTIDLMLMENGDYVITEDGNKILNEEAGECGVTVSENGHYLKTGDKVKISGSETLIFNGVWPITVANNTTYTYTLPENTGVTYPSGTIKATPVASAWSATSNAVTMDTSVKGKNAVIEVSTVAIGSIKEVSIYNFGAGYVSTPTISTTSGGQDAVFTSGLGALTTYGGYNLGTTGTLSGVPKVQDNRYYQAFSYVVKSDFDVNQYRDAVKRMTHPSGMILFGEVAIRSNLSARLFKSAVNTVDDLGTIEQPGLDNSGKKYHNITLFQNAITTDVQFQSFGSNNEVEIYTADHPWQAMYGRLETDDEVNLQLEFYEEIDSIARTNSTMHTVTQTLHGFETGDVVAFSEVHHPIERPVTTNIQLEVQVPVKEENSRNDIFLIEDQANSFIAMETASSIIERADGWIGQITGQEWQGEHVITTAPTTNTYTITPTKDDGVGQMYDGHLYIQLEDQATGNNIVTEDYSYSTFIEFESAAGGDNLLQEDGELYTPNSSTLGQILMDSVEAPASTAIQLEGLNPSRSPGDYLLMEGHGADVLIVMEALSSVEERVPSVIVLSDNMLMQPTNYLKAKTVSYANTFRANATNWKDPFSGGIIGQDRPTITLTCTTTLNNTTITTSDTSSIVVGMSVRGSGIPTIPVANVATITNSTTFELSEKATVSGSNSLTFDQEYEILLERGGTFLYPKLQFPEAETGTISIDMSFNSDLLLEDDNGAYGWGYILEENSGSAGNGPQRYISLEDTSQHPTTNTAQYIRTERQYNYIQFELQLEDDSGNILLEDSSGIIIAVEAQTHRDLTYSNPYMETKATIDLINSLGYQLITESAVVLLMESAVVLLMEDDDIIVQENTTWAHAQRGLLSANRTAGGAFYIEDSEFGDIIVQEDTTLNREPGGAFYIEDTEFGDIIVSEEKIQHYYTVGLDGSGESLILEDGDRIEYDSALFWEDPHETYTDITNPEKVLLEHNTWTIIHSAPVYQFIDHLTTLGRLLMEDESLIANERDDYIQFEIELEDDTGYILLEDSSGIIIAVEPASIAADYIVLEKAAASGSEKAKVHGEIHLEDSMRYHLITEDNLHFIEEGDGYTPASRFITGESHSDTTTVKPSTREIEYNYPDGNPGLERLTPQSTTKFFTTVDFGMIMENGDYITTEDGYKILGGTLGKVFNDWKDTNIATVPYGMQAFRPHYYSQWASIDLGFVDGQFEMEDNTGIILLEHPVTNQDKLIQEDFPGVQEDIFATDKARFDFILLEPATLTELGDYDYTSFDRLQCETLSGAGLVTLESSHLGLESVVDLVQEIELEDDSGYIQLEEVNQNYQVTLEDGTGYILLQDGLGNIISENLDVVISYLISEEIPPAYGTHTGHQSWTVLPAYQYTRIPTRLQGLISIADEGTTVTGSEYCSFTTQLKVGEEFQTEDVTIIAEDSGGDVVLETDERLEHEEITMGDINAFVLDTTKNIRLQDFRWLISSEDASPMPGQPTLSRHVAAHSSHANVIGVYLERTMSLDDQDDSYLSVGESSSGTNIGSGGDEASAWDTNNESYWIPTHESNDRIGITKVVSGSDDGTVRVESLEWENVNMIWEDFSKQLIIEPQAFIVGSITNDSSMTVTRKHLGGVTEAEYRL